MWVPKLGYATRPVLYRGLRLGVARDWAQRHPDRLSPRERQFLDASDDTENRERRAVVRRHRQLRWLSAGLAVLVVASTGLAVWARIQQHNTDTQRQQWILDPERVAELECPRARYTITPAVWARITPSLPYESVC